MKRFQNSHWFASGMFLALSSIGLASSAFASTYAGTYIGTYSGDDSGALTVVIDGQDNVTCDFFSTPKNTHYLLTGGVNFSVPIVDFTCSAGTPSYVLTASGNNGDPSTLQATTTVRGSWSGSEGGGNIEGAFTATYSSNSTTPGDPLFNPQALSGLWYDPAFTGTGFNILETSVGLIITYYGWDKSGARLWLTANGPSSVAIGQTINLTMNQTVGGTFSAPANPSTSKQWGTVALTFTSCTAATATLDGIDGARSESLQLLIGASGAPTCQ